MKACPWPKTSPRSRAEVPLGDRHNMIFSGTAVTYGRGKAVVTATGMQTQMGAIAGMLKEAPAETTPLQKELARVGKLLGTVVVVIAIVMIATIVVVEEVRGFAAILRRSDSRRCARGCRSAGGPAGGRNGGARAWRAANGETKRDRSPSCRRGDARLGERDRVRQDRHADEERNDRARRRDSDRARELRRDGLRAGSETYGARDGNATIDGALRSELTRALAAADRANNAVLHEQGNRWTVQGDPTEGALIVAARKAGLEAEVLDARFQRIAEVPFSSERKLMSTVHTDAKREEYLLAFTKGAPDVLLARCTQEESRRGKAVPLTPERRAAILAINEALAGEALRTLGVALRLAAPRFVQSRRDRRGHRAGPRFPRFDRHDRSAARRGGRSRRARKEARESVRS